MSEYNIASGVIQQIVEQTSLLDADAEAMKGKKLGDWQSQAALEAVIGSLCSGLERDPRSMLDDTDKYYYFFTSEDVFLPEVGWLSLTIACTIAGGKQLQEAWIEDLRVESVTLKVMSS